MAEAVPKIATELEPAEALALHVLLPDLQRGVAAQVGKVEPFKRVAMEVCRQGLGNLWGQIDQALRKSGLVQ